MEVGDAGDTDVVVFKGAVDLHFAAGDQPDTQDPSKRLLSGEAMHIDRMGTQSRIVSIFSNRFFSNVQSSDTSNARGPLIDAVTDNIDRDSQTWNFYEIVPGGMREDASAFVDRVSHEWNGLDDAGMPEFLIGGDYIKTFNDDKISKEIDISVTIARPCNLYILFDDRLAPPDWLRDQFVDTGSDLGVDVGPFRNVEDGTLKKDRLPGVGPGVLVDDVMSIWKAEFKHPQTVVLGPSGAVEHAKVNMYGIVATELATENSSANSSFSRPGIDTRK